MSISFVAYHCKSCSAPLFLNDYIAVDATDQYILVNNTQLRIPTFNNRVICYECDVFLGTKIAGNVLKINKDKLTKVTLTN